MMHLRNLNLNLIPVLQSVLRTQNITRAAEQLGMSQSAVSDALAKLRFHFNDELLVRSGRTMVRTSMGELLLPLVDEAAEQISKVFGQLELDPLELKRRFVLATPDAVISTIGPSIVQAVEREAPNVDVQFIPLSATTRRDKLAVFDLLAGPSLMRSWGDQLCQSELYKEKFVCILRRDHPLLDKPITKKDYWAAKHAVYRPDAARVTTVEDQFISMEKGHQREVVRVPNFWLLARFVENSDYIALLHYRLAVYLKEFMKIEMADPPFQSNEVLFYLFWDAVHQNDPAHIWFRGLVSREASRI